MNAGTAQPKPQSAERIAAQIEEYLAANPHAMVVEEGECAFHFGEAGAARYSITPERDRCVLQVWSEERNIVRRVVEAQLKNNVLRLRVLRFGQTKPMLLEICGRPEGPSPSAKKQSRAVSQRLLRRLLEKEFPGWKLERMTSAPDLEHSFGPAYVRGLLRLGSRYLAVLGVGASETQATVDGAATAAVLWLDYCREHFSAKGHVEGVSIFVPSRRSAAVLLRISHLDRDAAKWRIFEVDERNASASELDCERPVNFETRLVHCADEETMLARFADSIERMRAIAPQAEVAVLSTSEISFRLQGLEFARATMAPTANSFRLGERILFGAAPAEYELNDKTELLLRRLVARIVETRTHRNRLHPFYRMQSERWLESIARREIAKLDDRLDPIRVYEQVPAFSAGDRAMIDLLGVTRDGRLAVIELKAEEDLHLPMQGLDYWARVRWHHRRGELQQHGYFSGLELSPEDPILLMAAPSLHVHPATAVLLRYLSPEIDWRLIGLDEHWRDGIRAIFRKHPADLRTTPTMS